METHCTSPAHVGDTLIPAGQSAWRGTNVLGDFVFCQRCYGLWQKVGREMRGRLAWENQQDALRDASEGKQGTGF